MSGPSWIGLLRYSVVILCVSLSVSWWKNSVRFVRAIARMPFVRASCLQTKLRLCIPWLGTWKPTPTNIGTYRGLSMAFVIAHIIGTTRLTGSSNLLALNPLSRTSASSQVFSKTLMILQVRHHLLHFLLGYTLMTLFTCWKILQLRPSSAVSSVPIAKSTLWALLNGFLAFTSPGRLLHLLSWFILTSRALLLTLWRASFRNLAIPHQRLLLIAPGSRLMLLHLPQMMMTLQLRFNVRRPTSLMLEVSVGLSSQLVLTSHQFTHSCHPTVISLPWVT
jgi:hypothetical protein